MTTNKTKAELIADLNSASKRIAELEQTLAGTTLAKNPVEQDKLENLLRVLPVGVSVLNGEGKVVFENPALYKILDMNSEELHAGAYKNRKYLAADGSTMPADGFASVRTRKSGEPVYDVETGILKEDGKTIWVNVSAVPVNLSDWKTVIVTADITKRKLLEKDLQENKQRYTLSFQKSAIPVLLVKLPEVAIADANEAAEKLTGYTLDEMRGKNAAQLGLISPAKRKETISEFDEDGSLVRNEMRIISRTGEERIIIVNTNPLQINGQPYAITTMQDITERKQAELKQRELTERLNLATRSAHMGIWDWDIVKNEILWDDQMYALNGLKPGEFGGAYEGWLNGVHPEDREYSNEESAAAVRGEKEYDTKFRVVWPDGSIHWLKANGEVFRDEHGTPLRMVGVNYDITERKQTEEVIERTRNTLAEAQKIAHLGSFEYIAATQTTVWSEEEYHIYGLDPADPSPEYDIMLQKCIHPDDAALLHETFTKAMQSNSVYELEHRVVRPDGSVRWVYDRALPYFNERGELIRYIGITLDITERKRNEKELKQSQENFARVFETNPSALTITRRADGKFININQAYTTVMGYTREEILGQNAGAFSIYVDYTERSRLMEKLNEEGYVNKYELAVRGKDNQVRNILVSMEPVLYDNEDCILSAFIDITERKESEGRMRLFGEVMANMAEGVALTRANDIKIVYTNPKFDGMFGYDPGELIGQPITIINAPDHMDPEEKAHEIVRALEQENIWSGEVLNIKKNGETIWTSANISTFEHPEYGRVWVTVQSDISERKRTEEALRASEEQYRQLSLELEERVKERTAEVQDLYDNAPNGYHSLDKDGIILKINQTELSWLGYSAEELLGQHYKKILSPNSWEAFAIYFPLLKQRGWVNDIDLDLRRKDDSTFPVLLNATIVTDAEGNFLRTRTTLFDNTERKKAEQALRESQQNLQYFFDTASDLIQSMDENGNFLYVNANWCSVLGYTSEEAVRLNMLDVIDPIHHEHCRDLLKELTVDQHPQQLEVVFRTKKGETITVEGSVSSRKVKGGHIATNGIFRNITERKLADQALRESEEQNRLLFEVTPESVVLFDGEGRIIKMNKAFGNLTGYAKEELTQHTLDEMNLFSLEQIETLASTVLETIGAEARVANADFKLIDRLGTIHDVGVSVFGLMIDGRQHYLTTMYDLTKRKQTEEALRLANLELERAMRTKDEFLASMSHELRTPLNSILGLTESMLEETVGSLNERQQKYLGIVSESGRHLLALINDILDIAKIESGQIQLEMNRVEVSNLCEASLRMVRQMAQKKNINLLLKLEPGVDTLQADERRLKQMVVNLLSNAVKFTPNGGQVGLNVYVEPERTCLVMEVWDTGIGIREEDLPRLFQPFVQLDSSLSRESAGTGLGLAIVAQMIRLHGGSVEVQSEFGKGSRFSLSLPWSSEKNGEKKKSVTKVNLPVSVPSKGDEYKATILLVEDTESAIIVIQDFLELNGYRVEVARNGAEGITKAVTLSPDLILMDVQMPGMDGIEATRLLRKEPALAKTPILALTALAMTSDRQHCLDAGMNDYISKPVPMKELIRIIQNYLPG